MSRTPFHYNLVYCAVALQCDPRILEALWHPYCNSQEYRLDCLFAQYVEFIESRAEARITPSPEYPISFEQNGQPLLRRHVVYTRYYAFLLQRTPAELSIYWYEKQGRRHLLPLQFRVFYRNGGLHYQKGQGYVEPYEEEKLYRWVKTRLYVEKPPYLCMFFILLFVAVIVAIITALIELGNDALVIFGQVLLALVLVAFCVCVLCIARGT